MSQQLPLPWRWPDHQRFDYFYAGQNGATVDLCERAAKFDRARWLMLTGAPGTGKTHLLLATCQAARARQARVQYVPLDKLGGHADQVIRASAGNHLVAFDNLDAIAGHDAAEHALFDAYNRARHEGAIWLLSASDIPASLGFHLPDLVSRLNSLTLAKLEPLDEGERREVFKQYAAQRGIELDERVLDWLFVRYARDLGSLARLLERLDQASLAAGRRITIPFLRTFLHTQNA